LTNRPTPAYRDRILSSFGGIEAFMSAKSINPDHVLAKSWVSFVLAEMEGAEEEEERRAEKAQNSLETTMNSYGIKPWETGGWENIDGLFNSLVETKTDAPKKLGSGVKRKGKKKGGKGVVARFGGMENFMNSHGIKPYDDGAFEDASAILDQIDGSKQKSGRVAKKRKVGKGKRGKRGT
jgi:hypothetical protein